MEVTFKGSNNANPHNLRWKIPLVRSNLTIIVPLEIIFSCPAETCKSAMAHNHLTHFQHCLIFCFTMLINFHFSVCLSKWDTTLWCTQHLYYPSPPKKQVWRIKLGFIPNKQKQNFILDTSKNFHFHVSVLKRNMLRYPYIPPHLKQVQREQTGIYVWNIIMLWIGISNSILISRY